jgi:hypothetical protein
VGEFLLYFPEYEYKFIVDYVDAVLEMKFEKNEFCNLKRSVFVLDPFVHRYLSAAVIFF